MNDGYYYEQIKPTIKDIDMEVRNNIIHYEYDDNRENINLSTAEYFRCPSYKKQLNTLGYAENTNNTIIINNLLGLACIKKQNIVLSLRLRGDSFRKIANKTGIPLSTVYYRYKSAIKRIRDKLNIDQ